MEEFEREALLISLERQHTDEGKISMAKRLLSGSILRVEELCEVLALLHYDSSRQELIQHINGKLEDPENLPKIYAMFRLPQDRPPQPMQRIWHRKQRQQQQ